MTNEIARADLAAMEPYAVMGYVQNVLQDYYTALEKQFKCGANCRILFHLKSYDEYLAAESQFAAALAESERLREVLESGRRLFYALYPQPTANALKQWERKNKKKARTGK